MSKAENFTVRMSEDLKQRMKDHPEINWSHVIREHVQSMLDDVERMNELATDSQLSEEDIAELTDMINAAAAERAQEDAENSDHEAGTLRAERKDEEAPQRRDLTDVDAT
jgi:multidrug resistance efflux pump